MIIDRLLTLKETGKLLNVSKQTLQRWDNSGKLIAVRTEGGHRRYKLSDIEKILGENNAYDKGFQDAIEKAKQIIISFIPLPSNKNHNINQDIDLLEERQKYAHQVAKKFEEMMLNKERILDTNLIE